MSQTLLVLTVSLQALVLLGQVFGATQQPFMQLRVCAATAWPNRTYLRLPVRR